MAKLQAFQLQLFSDESGTSLAQLLGYFDSECFLGSSLGFASLAGV